MKSKVQWVVSYYNASDIDRCTQTLTSIGVDISMVKFKPLEDFSPDR